MKLGKLKLVNFASLKGEHFIDFSYFHDPKILVTGDCRIAGGSDSNGAGKTSIFDAIAWCIFGKTPKKLAVDEVVNEDSTYCSVMLELIGDSTITILRQRKLGSETSLSLWINDADKSGRLLEHTQESILSQLGIQSNNRDYFEDFLNSTYVSTEVIDTFASKGSSNKDRINLISRFLNLEVVEEAMHQAEDGAKSYRTQALAEEAALEVVKQQLEQLGTRDFNVGMIRIHQGVLNEVELTILDNEKDLAQATSMLDAEKELVGLKAQIEILKNDVASKLSFEETQLTHCEARIAEIDESAKRIKELEEALNPLHADISTSTLSVKGIINELNARLTKAISRKAIADEELKSLQKMKEHALTCPSCNARLLFKEGTLYPFNMGTTEDDIVTVEVFLRGLNEGIMALITEIDVQRKTLEGLASAKSKYDLINQELGGLKQRASGRQSFVDRREEARQSLINLRQSYDAKIASLLTQCKPIEEALVNHKPGSVKDLTERHKKLLDTRAQAESALKNREENLGRIEVLELAISNKWTELSKLNEMMDNWAFWAKGFSEIRRLSIEAFLPEFQSYTNYLLGLIQSGMSIELSTIRSKKKSEDIVENFTINVVGPSGKVRAFNTFSQGEKRRIASCIALALKHLSQNKGYQPFEFSLFDEIIDGLDTTGQDEFFKLLDVVPGTSMVISHSTDLNTRFSSHLHIVRETDGTAVTTFK